jgi:Phycobilisome degradation protein nblA
MTPECLSLSIEQEFKIRSFEIDSQHLSDEELRKLFIEVSRQLFVKDNVIRHLIKNGTI